MGEGRKRRLFFPQDGYFCCVIKTEPAFFPNFLSFVYFYRTQKELYFRRCFRIEESSFFFFFLLCGFPNQMQECPNEKSCLCQGKPLKIESVQSRDKCLMAERMNDLLSQNKCLLKASLMTLKESYCSPWDTSSYFLFMLLKKKKKRHHLDLENSWKFVYPYLPTRPLGQDMTQGHFFSGVWQVSIQSFPSRQVASPRLKNLVCPTIYP